MAISEWDQRQLCPDGGCIGVIGPDGTCKVCGRVAPDWGDERRRGLVAPEDADAEGEAEAGGGDEDEISPSAPALLGEVAEWHRRQLCSDGGCVGIIGPDGTCKVCGKPASGEEEDEGEEDEDEEDEDEEDEAAEDEKDEEDEEEDEEEEDEEDEEEEDEDDEAAADEEEAAEDGGDRKLCPDGACIGVIGPDGRCKVCGKEAA